MMGSWSYRLIRSDLKQLQEMRKYDNTGNFAGTTLDPEAS